MMIRRRQTVSLLVLSLLLSLILGAPAAVGAQPAPTPAWQPPDPGRIKEQELQLKDQEIRLLKRQLDLARQQQTGDQIGRIVYETQLRVAELHGFAVKNVVVYAPLDKSVLDRLVDESIREEYPGKKQEHYVWLNQLFAALPQPFDMSTTLRDLLGEQVGGLFDPHSKRLFVKTDFPLESPMGLIILSHEICHAFQDQNFALLKMGIEDPGNGDRAMAISSLAEGDATLLMGEFFAHFGKPTDIFGFLPSVMNMDQQKLESSPPAVQEELLFPYLKGMAFFQTLHGRVRRDSQLRFAVGDPSWRNEVFKDPPISTQQILHPDLYLANKMPAHIEIPVLAQAGPVTGNVAGEFGITQFLEPLLGTERAQAAAAGWNGDRMAVADSTDGKRRLVRWVTRWDTPRDADEFATGLEDLFSARFPGTVTWQGARAERKATPPGGELKILRTGQDDVELRGSFEPGRPFPKVKTTPAKKLPGLF